jgi:hypothetical protein
MRRGERDGERDRRRDDEAEDDEGQQVLRELGEHDPHHVPAL